MFTSKGRRAYLRLLETMSTDWLIKSSVTPGAGMSEMAYLLHRVIIRRRGA